MKAKYHIVTAAVIALTVFNSTVRAADFSAPKPEFLSREQLAKWNKDQGAAKDGASALVDSVVLDMGFQFYTGRPFESDSGSYLFKYRAYDAGLNRWTTADPSGFPDGPNNQAYVCNGPTFGIDIEGLQTGLIAGLDITIRVYRSGSWVDITGGGDLNKSTDTRMELFITNDPYDASAMLSASRKPLGGYAVDQDPSGSIYPSLASQSIGGWGGLPTVSGGYYWQERFWPTGHSYPLVKLDGSISDMLVGGAWNAVVIYNPSGGPTPMTWSIGGNIVE